MKLLRWAAAGASVYVVYKYSIGKKAKGEDVFKSPERDLGEEDGDTQAESETADGEETPAERKKQKT